METRLQNVARRMVSHQGARRSEPGRPPAGPSLPQSNGFAGPAPASVPLYGAGAGFGSGGQVNQLLNQPSRSLPQNGILSDIGAGLQQASVPGLGQGAPSTFPGSAGSNPGLLGRGAASPQLSNGPISSPAVPNPESGLGSLQLPPQFGLQRPGGLPASGLLQAPALGLSQPPVMSNGAPVMLRGGGTRDWTPGASPSLLNVRSAPPSKLLLSTMSPVYIRCRSPVRACADAAPALGAGAVQLAPALSW